MMKRERQRDEVVMIDVGSFRSRDCYGISRRAFVRAGMALPLGVGLGAPALGKQAAAAGPARSVVLLWLWGGPSHLDTFDPKPQAPQEIRGPFDTLVTRTPGLRVSELFPRLAQRSQLFTVVRSNKNLTATHRIAASISLTGEQGANGDAEYGPSIGSIVHRVQAGRHDLPPYISVTPGALKTALGIVKGAGGGGWGKAHDPVSVRCSDTGGVDIPSLKLLEGLPSNRLADRKLLLKQLDQIARLGDRGPVETWGENFRRAYRLLTSGEGQRAFDLSRESSATRGRYGRSVFGQSCLLARRLVEAEVPFIQVNWSQWVENLFDSKTDFGWDTHWLNFEHMVDRHGPILDRALSTFLDDLSQRGLLDQTLVVAMGEFGRTPKISGNAGRDHWPSVYSSLWAGGGVVPGQVIGQSDRRGADSLTDPVTPDMVATTMLQQAGIGTEQRAELRVFPDSHVIEGLV